MKERSTIRTLSIIVCTALSLNFAANGQDNAHQAADDTVVYYIAGKKRFHAEGCPRLEYARQHTPDSITQITYKQGLAKGLLYCSRCPVDDANKAERGDGGGAGDEEAAGGVTVHTDVTTGPFVSMGPDGRLVYRPYTDKGDKILDFSYCGYKASEEPIPDIPTVETLNPLPGEAAPEGTMAYPRGPDSASRIQAALDKVAARQPAASGYRGAVLLTRGTYYVKGGLTMSSGVVLRGQGDGPDGTVLIFDNPQGVGISMGQAVPTVELEAASVITDAYVPSGSVAVTVQDAGLFDVGDEVHITKTVNDTWIETLGMTFPDGARPGRRLTPWTPQAYQIKHVRRIAAIDGNRIRFDVPLPQSFVAEHGGGKVTKIDTSGTASHMGVEGLRIISNYDTSVTSMVRAKQGEYQADEEGNMNAGIQLRCVNSWVRDCTVMHTSRQAVGVVNSRYVTVRDCQSLRPISVIRGGRRYSYSNSDSSMVLVYNCFAEDGRHDFVTGSRDTGPIAFVKGRVVDANAASETHQRWATGVLFDRIVVKNGGGIAAINRGEAGSGHGWSGANVVMWNCVAPFLQVENPPTPEQNFAIGCVAEAPADARWSGVGGDGFIESPGAPVQPDSLFEQQLIDRIGESNARAVLR